MAIVTSAYRHKRPPRKRAKAAAIVAPAIVTIDPKTRTAKKGRRLTELEAAAEAGRAPPRFGSAPAPQLTTKPPQPANDDGPREPAIVTAKKGRRPVGSGAAAKVVSTENPPVGERAGEQQPNPAHRKSAIVTVRARKTVQRQREQQQDGETLGQRAQVGDHREADRAGRVAGTAQVARQCSRRGVPRTRAQNRRCHNVTGNGDMLVAPLHSLGLDTRATNTLLNNGLRTIGDLVAKTEVEIWQLPYFGPTTLARIKAKLTALGLGLRPGPPLPKWK